MMIQNWTSILNTPGNLKSLSCKIEMVQQKHNTAISLNLSTLATSDHIKIILWIDRSTELIQQHLLQIQLPRSRWLMPGHYDKFIEIRIRTKTFLYFLVYYTSLLLDRSYCFSASAVHRTSRWPPSDDNDDKTSTLGIGFLFMVLVFSLQGGSPFLHVQLNPHDYYSQQKFWPFVVQIGKNIL